MQKQQKKSRQNVAQQPKNNWCINVKEKHPAQGCFLLRGIWFDTMQGVLALGFKNQLSAYGFLC